MPHGRKVRGSRGKRNTKQQHHHQQLTRSAPADQHRLIQAVALSTELNKSTAASPNAALPAEAGDPPVPTGVIQVSLDSDSDHNLSNSDSEPSTYKRTTITYPTPYHRVETTKHPDGRITFHISFVSTICEPTTELQETTITLNKF